jgi:opacity protein-like surface antigen
MRTTVQRGPGTETLSLLERALISAGLFLVMLLIGVQLARAAEIIPSVGITRPVNSDDNTSKISGGLALRGDLVPFLMAEIGASYRSEDRFGGNLHVRQWPITASLWLKPVPMLYAGGGAGWYQTTLHYAESLQLSDETKQKFGVHLGGGMRLPLAPMVGLDLNGRYVFLDNVDQKLTTEKFDPDFWTTSLGLAIKF